MLNEFHGSLHAGERQVFTKSPVRRAIQYALPRWDGLTRNCEHGMLSIDKSWRPLRKVVC